MTKLVRQGTWKNTEKITFFIILIKFFMNKVTHRDAIICILSMFVHESKIST